MAEMSDIPRPPGLDAEGLVVTGGLIGPAIEPRYSRVQQAKTLPVMEIFGPTIQGEGALAGLPTHFIRFGLCDYRCSWCDSMFSVEPAQVKEHARKLTVDEIVAEVCDLGSPLWVTLSGGNPALHDLGPLVDELHAQGLLVAVETQGSRWRDWLAEVDCLTVSPKPPSSGMASAKHAAETKEFMRRASDATADDPSKRALKIVVFDEADFVWATDFITRRGTGHWGHWPTFLSVGTNPIGEWGSEVTSRISTRQVRDELGERYRWLCEKVAGREELAMVRVLPQLHVIAWGHRRGV